MKNNRDIAIVGMSCIFPGAGDVPTFWSNIENKVDAIRPVPEFRMEGIFFDETAHEADRFYCRKGGFIDEYAEFDAATFGILPVSVEGTEPEQLLALRLAYQALGDAGVWERGISLERAGIIIGKGNYTGPGATRAIEIIRTGQQIVELLQELLPDLSNEKAERVKKEFQSRKGRFGADTAMGLIPNLVASLVSNRLDMGGPAYTVDAACASSLVAIDHAIKELVSGNCDVMLAGGVHACQNAPFWSIFSQLGALSRKEQIRPFDRRADGLLIGEGCGFVVLRRLEDAVREGHRIYAVIKGVGICSDGAGASVMSPSVKGQSRAILRAWENAGVDALQLGYIEAHGTGTPLGDRVELETLTAVFGRGASLPKVGIGSVKSNIGHAMPAAGIAGVIKTALALYHGKLPPTLHCEEPAEALAGSRFVPVQEVVDWVGSGLPLRAGVNAFGFGGINAHVVMERWDGDAGKSRQQAGSLPELDKVLVLARESQELLLRALEEGMTDTGKGDWRIVVFDPTRERVEKAIKIVQRGRPWRNRQDVWFTSEPLVTGGGKVAFLFPGLDGLMGGEIKSVGEYFGLSVAADNTDMAARSVLDSALRLTERSHVLDSALKQLGVRPDLNAGHSVGEWLAGRSAGWVSEETVTLLLAQLDNQSFDIKETGFLVVGSGYEQMEPMMEGIEDLYLSNDNCPQQVILCGTNRALGELMPVLREQQIFHQLLPFSSGFHSPFLKDRLDQLMDTMRGVHFQPAQIPLWSATTLSVYPAEESAIRALSVQHLLEPVRFRQLTERLYTEGVRVFIQVGSGGLTGFIDDTLRSKAYSAVAANVAARTGLAQLQRVLAALYVEGRETGLSFLGVTKKEGTGARPVRLQLGSPFVRGLETIKELVISVSRGEAAGSRAESSSAEDGWGVNSVAGDRATGEVSGVEKIFIETMAALSDSQEEVLSLFRKQGIGRAGTIGSPGMVGERMVGVAAAGAVGNGATAENGNGTTVVAEQKGRISYPLDISLDTHPYLIDHALVRQREGWSQVKDMDPVIPMTMMLELFGEIAEAQAPGRVLRRMRDIQILQWMNVAEPFRETVKGEWREEGVLSLSLEKYAAAEMELAAGYGVYTGEDLEIGESLGISLTPAQVYEQHLFHGPAYQGIREVLKIAEAGITGIIEGSTGKGSLLDNAGQLFGLWLQFILEKDKIAFPVKIKEIEFYSDRLDQGGLFECTCRLTSLNEGFATGEFLISKNGRVWAAVRGWQNRRLEIDSQFWRVAMSPLHHFLSEEIEPGLFFFHNAYSRMVSWDLIFKRYFSSKERDYYSSMTPARKKEWTISRITAKDAVRALMLRYRKAAYYPIEFEIHADEKGRPFPYGANMDSMYVSLAHKGTDAVAIAGYGSPVGVDIETIEEREPSFLAAVFYPEELALGGEMDMAEWATRCWVAKEAYGKYLGLGLQGNPKAYRIEEAKGDVLRIKEVVIKTIKYKNYIIGWTL
jgi:3-oxoacyl-(acyl-carrier-protein) synthase/malonyl CoA-acyl carrier protein transacylase/phosphopantetheinyl transferase